MIKSYITEQRDRRNAKIRKQWYVMTESDPELSYRKKVADLALRMRISESTIRRALKTS